MTPTDPEPRLDAILADYLHGVDAGQPPDREALLARHPDLATELAQFFLDEDRLDGWAKPLREVSRAACVDGDLDSLVAGDGAASLGQFGDYELLAQLGRGGMGVVYRARQRSLNRLVALKMILAGQHAGPTELRRFRNEAEAIAALSHPHIVPVYEVGECAGQPYFTMKLIAGGSLAARQADFTDRPRDAARLVSTIARAVHYAHEHGVLHRDLKPSNVLLDADGLPHVSDFGLAKRVDRSETNTCPTELTATGALLGTPGYMAPEQASGHRLAMTTATDVYGLGTILYALLTGRAPFQGDDLFHILDRVRTEPPTRPGRDNPRLERDLELICLKALEKEPARRYASAAAFADELDRFLHGHPLSLTRPVSRAERAWRWYRRHRLPATLAGLLSLAILGVAIVAPIVALSLRASAHRERLARDRAENERDRAETNFRTARDAVDQFTALGESPQLRARGLEKLRATLLGRAAKFYERFTREASDNPALEAERARSYLRVGRISRELGSNKDALTAQERAREVFARLVRDPGNSADYEDGLAQALEDAGQTYQLLGQPAQARSALEQGLPIRQRLAREHPASVAYQQSLAKTIFVVGRLYQVTGESARAEQTYRQALEGFDRLAREHPNMPLYRYLAAQTHANLGALYLVDSAKLARSREALETVLSMTERLVRDDPSEPTYQDLQAFAWHYLGRYHRLTRHWDQADTAYARGQTAREQLVDAHPDVPDYRYKLSVLLHGRGELHLAQRHLDKAGTFLARALDFAERLGQDYPTGVVERGELGALYYDVACFHAVCAGQKRNDPSGPGDRDTRADQEAERALSFLKKAEAAGFFAGTLGVRQLKTDSDLASLRSRADFQQFLRGMEQARAATPRP
jgi:serine/threonine-protein kinase